MTSITISPTNPSRAVERNSGRAQATSNVSGRGLIRPKFFPGQLLTEKDLQTLVTWTQQKTALQRFRMGYGVADGLALTMRTDRPTELVLSAGYAVDAAGRDLFVPKPHTESVADLVELLTVDPCDDEKKMVWDIGAVHPVDVFLKYNERLSDPQTMLGSGTVGRGAQCEYSRVHEGCVVRFRLPEGADDPLLRAAKQFEKRYQRTSNVVEAFRKRFDPVDSADSDKMKEWLLGAYRKQHTHFGFLERLICGDGAGTEQWAVEVLFWIVMSRRGALVANWREREHGVRIGRIYLRSVQVGDKATGHIEVIDTAPPFRRPLAPRTLPAPIGTINGGEFLWETA